MEKMINNYENIKTKIAGIDSEVVSLIIDGIGNLCNIILNIKQFKEAYNISVLSKEIENLYINTTIAVLSILNTIDNTVIVQGLKGKKLNGTHDNMNVIIDFANMHSEKYIEPIPLCK